MSFQPILARVAVDELVDSRLCDDEVCSAVCIGCYSDDLEADIAGGAVVHHVRCWLISDNTVAHSTESFRRGKR